MKLTKVVSLLAAVCLSSAASAAEYPIRPIRIIVPYAAGGPSDLGARLLADSMQKQLGQSVIVDNRGGAGGVNGTEAVVNGQHDGYTLVLGAVGPLVFIPASKKVRYNPVKDLVPIGTIWRSAQMLAVSPKLGVRSVDEFIKVGQERPGRLKMGSAGIGTVTHMALELLQRETNLKVTHVPYKSTGPVISDVLGGQIDGLIGDISVLAPHVRSGALIGLAVLSSEASRIAPELPTMRSVGYPGVETANWYGLFAPAKTPPEIVNRLREVMTISQQSSEYREALAKHGAETGPAGAQPLADLLTAETEKWVPILKSAGVKLD